MRRCIGPARRSARRLLSRTRRQHKGFRGTLASTGRRLRGLYRAQRLVAGGMRWLGNRFARTSRWVQAPTWPTMTGRSGSSPGRRHRLNWPACRGTGHQHRVRGRRPARGGSAGSGHRTAVHSQGRTCNRAELCRPPVPDQPVREPASRTGRGPRRSRVLAAWPGAGTVRRGAGHAEERQRVLPAVPGLRAGADPRAAATRRREGAGDEPGAVPAQDHADPRQPARS